jgi:hypothetical protein
MLVMHLSTSGETVAAEYDNTSFGIQRRKRDAEHLEFVRGVVAERLEFVTSQDKRDRLIRLVAAMDEVLKDLNS